MSTLAQRAHVVVTVHCASCKGAVLLECEGLPGYMGYQTHNEYFCPHCHKQNHHLTSGAIISAQVPTNT